MANFFVFVLLQDDLEVHYSGFKTNHIHNLSDLVQENLGAQVCQIFICVPISNSIFFIVSLQQLCSPKLLT